MKPGKFLEMLVECLQKLLTTDGITVTRNEKFYNSQGQQIGEVDIVLRGRFGSSDMVVGIECRDRAGAQDRNWIRTIIGKRNDLAPFGFRHWIAVSNNGFRSTAQDLAVQAGIELLVPGKVEPIEPDKIGPHTWMKFSMTHSEMHPGEVQAVINHDSELLLDKIQVRVKKDGWNVVSVNQPGEAPIPIGDFIQRKVELFLREQERASNGADFIKPYVVNATNLQGVMEDIHFSIDKLTCEVTVYQETLHPKFRMLAFVVPGTQDILGIIGINEYRHHDTSSYLMVSMKPDDVNNFILVMRDAEGNPIEGFERRIVFSMPVYPSGTPARRIRFRLQR